VLTDVSVLSPSVRPAEERAKVVLLREVADSGYRLAPGDTVIHGGGVIRRYFQTPIRVS
jgi:hypothetical protein